jgi:hypothetical protein
MMHASRQRRLNQLININNRRSRDAGVFRIIDRALKRTAKFMLPLARLFDNL